MDNTTIASLVLAGLLLLLLAGGFWIALSLLTVGMVLMGVFTTAPMGSLVASTLWDSSWGWALTALPLFIWMGEILFRSNLSSNMFQGLAPWVNRLPGGLLPRHHSGTGPLRGGRGRLRAAARVPGAAREVALHAGDTARAAAAGA